MATITPTELHSVFANMGIISQLRSDGKIVFYDTSIEGFKDADGDDGIFFIVSIPFPGFLYIHAASVFDGVKAAEDLNFLQSLGEYISHSLVGSYELNDEGSRISWSAGIYHNNNKDDLRENVLGVISNFLSHVKSVHDGAVSNQTDDNAFLSRSSLEDAFRGGASSNCHPLEIIGESQEETNKEKIITCEITLSENLLLSVRQEVESRIEDIRKYLVKNEFSLPLGYSLRIQHGNDEKNVESGFNKGPYLSIVDPDGSEKKNMKLFMSRRGNLNSYIAVSTILSRL